MTERGHAAWERSRAVGSVVQSSPNLVGSALSHSKPRKTGCVSLFVVFSPFANNMITEFSTGSWTNKVYLQLSGVAHPFAEISWFVSMICRLVNIGAKSCRLQIEINFQKSFHVRECVLADLTYRFQAALPAWHCLSTGQTVGSSRFVQVWRYWPFGLGKRQGCRGVTQAVSATPILLHHPGLGLLINGARCRKEASWILKRIINLQKMNKS